MKYLATFLIGTMFGTILGPFRQRVVLVLLSAELKVLSFLLVVSMCIHYMCVYMCASNMPNNYKSRAFFTSIRALECSYTELTLVEKHHMARTLLKPFLYFVHI